MALLYLAGTLLLLDQLADLAATLLANSPSPGAANWRFGAFGLVTSRLSVLLIADVMLFAAAIGLDHRKVLRLLGVFHLLLVPVLLGALAIFGLDWLQVRGRVPAGGRIRFHLAGLRAAMLALLATLLAGWGGLTAFRAGRHSRTSRHEGELSPLISIAGQPRGRTES